MPPGDVQLEHSLIAGLAHAPPERDIPGERLVIPIEGMHCADCALNIEHSIEHVPGVLEANVDYVMETATIHYDPFRTDVNRIQRAITKPGYVVSETMIESWQRFWLEKRLAFYMAITGNDCLTILYRDIGDQHLFGVCIIDPDFRHGFNRLYQAFIDGEGSYSGREITAIDGMIDDGLIDNHLAKRHLQVGGWRDRIQNGDLAGNG